MRSTLSPTPTQQWMSVGMSKWHQAIARREATRIANRVNRLVIQWTVLHSQSYDSLATQESAMSIPGNWRGQRSVFTETPQLVLIDRKATEIAVEHCAKNGRVGASLLFAPTGQFEVGQFQAGQFEAAGPLFVLWDWGSSGKSSLEWATSLGFVGVIFDFSTLRSWVRVAVERLPSTLKELHPLVATLPHHNSVQPRK